MLPPALSFLHERNYPLKVSNSLIKQNSPNILLITKKFKLLRLGAIDRNWTFIRVSCKSFAFKEFLYALSKSPSICCAFRIKGLCCRKSADFLSASFFGVWKTKYNVKFWENRGAEKVKKAFKIWKIAFYRKCFMYRFYAKSVKIIYRFYVKTQKMHMFYWKVNEIQSNFYWKVNKLYKKTKRLAERVANFLCYLYFAGQKCMWLWDKICNRYKLNIEKKRVSAVFGRNAAFL